MGKTLKRLYGPAQLGNTTATRYTVPANTRTRITHILLNNPTGGAVTVTMSITADAAGTRILDAYSIAANSKLEWFPNHIMDAGEVLAAHASAATSIVCVIDGEEYTAG